MKFELVGILWFGSSSVLQLPKGGDFEALHGQQAQRQSTSFW